MIVEILVTAGACGLSCALGMFLGASHAQACARSASFDERSEAWREGYRTGLAIGRGILVRPVRRHDHLPARHE